MEIQMNKWIAFMVFLPLSLMFREKTEGFIPTILMRKFAEAMFYK